MKGLYQIFAFNLLETSAIELQEGILLATDFSCLYLFSTQLYCYSLFFDCCNQTMVPVAQNFLRKVTNQTQQSIYTNYNTRIAAAWSSGARFCGEKSSKTSKWAVPRRRHFLMQFQPHWQTSKRIVLSREKGVSWYRESWQTPSAVLYAPPSISCCCWRVCFCCLAVAPSPCGHCKAMRPVLNF